MEPNFPRGAAPSAPPRMAGPRGSSDAAAAGREKLFGLPSRAVTGEVPRRSATQGTAKKKSKRGASSVDFEPTALRAGEAPPVRRAAELSAKVRKKAAPSSAAIPILRSVHP